VNTRTISLVLSLVLVPPAAFFADAASAPLAAQETQRVPVEPETVRQKAKFVRNLVTKSVSAQTIEDKGGPESQAKLEEARALVVEANLDIEENNFEAANEKLDQSLGLVTKEAQKLSKSEVKGQRLQEAFERRRNAVTTFLSAYERVSGDKDVSAATRAHISDIKSMTAEADSLAEAGKLEEANKLLKTAYLVARGDIRELREGKTLTRTLNFETAEEEFSYERDRNDSHFMLLRFALSEKNPPKSRLTRIESLREQAQGLRDKADNQAGSGDAATAIDTILLSTEALLKAIRMSGVWIPG
jgi:hypothetical protein